MLLNKNRNPNFPAIKSSNAARLSRRSRNSLARRWNRRRRYRWSHRRSRPFCIRTTVVTVVEENRDDENYEPLQENLARLREMKIDGRNLDIVTFPMPKKIVREDLRSRRATRIFTSQIRACSCPYSLIRMMKLHYPSSQMFSRSPRDRDRLPRINLGPRHIPLPDAAAAG